MTFSSSKPCLAAKSSTLMRHSWRSSPSRTKRLDRVEDLGIGRIAERAEQGLRVVHGHATYANFAGAARGEQDGIPHKPVKAA